jgi:drug/metabolite transporter (DMT)-like permease
MFVGSSILVSTYIYGISKWGLTPWNALAIVNVPNMLAYLPIWYFFLPSGLDQASMQEIGLQVAFQGLGPGFFALIFFTLAATHLGASATSGFSAAVPAGVAVLGIPVLGEIPTALEWAGIGFVTIGLAILVLRKRT